jgi:hypothetical protein
MGALVGGLLTLLAAHRQTRMVLRDQAEVRRRDRAAADVERQRKCARVGMLAIADFMIASSRGSDAVERAGDSLYRIALVYAAALPLELYRHVWKLAVLIDEYTYGLDTDANSDIRSYAEFVHRALTHFSEDGRVVTDGEPPTLNGTWAAPEHTRYFEPGGA